jgi:hypothetical protein
MTGGDMRKTIFKTLYVTLVLPLLAIGFCQLYRKRWTGLFYLPYIFLALLFVEPMYGLGGIYPKTPGIPLCYFLELLLLCIPLRYEVKWYLSERNRKLRLRDVALFVLITLPLYLIFSFVLYAMVLGGYYQRLPGLYTPR